MDGAAAESAGTEPECACRLSGAEFRDRLAASKRVLRLARTRKETRGGYAFEFEASSERLRQLTELIDAERQCCPFLTFALRIPPGQKAFTLEITGPPKGILLTRAELLTEEFGPVDAL